LAVEKEKKGEGDRFKLICCDSKKKKSAFLKRIIGEKGKKNSSIFAVFAEGRGRTSGPEARKKKRFFVYTTSLGKKRHFHHRAEGKASSYYTNS